MKFSLLVLVFALLQLAASGPVSLTQKKANHLRKWNPANSRMWQMSGKYQGDIMLTSKQRNGVIDTSLRWKNREIPYVISNDFTSSEILFIEGTLEEEFSRTCITVRPRRSTDRDYVYITGENNGCWSYIGRLGGRQQLNLQRNGCIWYDTIVHEMLHAAGFYHQQSASDRDDFVQIHWENIEPGQEHNFEKLSSRIISDFGVTYDLRSIMHYDDHAFSANGEPTITALEPDAEIGGAPEFTDSDILKLNRMYNCV